jgi:hypothetical protein
LEELLAEYGDIFAMKIDGFGWTDRVYHHIDAQEPKLIRQPPAVLVRKNGDLRFYADCRKRNYITMKDCFPLPRIEDTLNTLAGAK